MFVRWKTREHWKVTSVWRRHRVTDKVYAAGKTKQYVGRSFSAVLVCCERVDGKPRQRIVAYLGHIKENNLEVPAQRLYFWEGVDRHLDELELGSGVRQQIEKYLRERVARPSREAVERDKRESLAKLRALFGRA